MELNRKRFNIPKLKGKTIPDKLKLSIESAHAGIINDNNFFYTPKSLVFGCESLKKFYKPLQKAHYSHTLGYIFDANYEQLKTIDSIDKAKTQEDLVINVKKYLKSNEYSDEPINIEDLKDYFIKVKNKYEMISYLDISNYANDMLNKVI